MKRLKIRARGHPIGDVLWRGGGWVYCTVQHNMGNWQNSLSCADVRSIILPLWSAIYLWRPYVCLITKLLHPLCWTHGQGFARAEGTFSPGFFLLDNWWEKMGLNCLKMHHLPGSPSLFPILTPLSILGSLSFPCPPPSAMYSFCWHPVLFHHFFTLVCT